MNGINNHIKYGSLWLKDQSGTSQDMQIQEKVNKIYKQMEALEAEAKAFLQKSKASKGSARDMYKQKCLMALKKKKQLEQQAKSYNSHQNALQQASFTMENVNNHK